MIVIGCISSYISPSESEWEISNWIGKLLSKDSSETSKTLLVLEGSFGELTRVSSKKGMEA